MHDRKCPNCRQSLAQRKALRDYACPKCGRFLDDLYRAEHRDQRRGPTLTRRQIAAEYRAIGRALPGWLPQ